ncbi:reverse transcriptase domain-containing protein [Tanacetum coccineum]
MGDFYRTLLIGRRGPIVPKTVPGTDFALKNHMVQLLQQNCQFNRFKDEDANEHLDKYLSITQFIKQNGISQDIINLNFFLFSLTHEAESWFYTLKTHYIHTWEEMVSKFLSKYYPYSRALQLRKDILNFWQLPTESVFQAWEIFKSCLRKCPDHRIFLVDQILTFYYGITMIDREKIMVVVGCNIMRKTPQEAYDLIENMTQHHFQCEAKVYHDTTTNMSAHYSKTTFASSEQVEDEPLEAKKSKINPLIREPPNTFLMRDKEIDLNSHENIDDLVPILRVSEKPLDSLECISKTFDMTITDPLFDFDSTLNSDNLIVGIHNEESDESEMETIMDEAEGEGGGKEGGKGKGRGSREGKGESREERGGKGRKGREEGEGEGGRKEGKGGGKKEKEEGEKEREGEGGKGRGVVLGVC